MSHIPASAMPHARPHDEHAPHADPAEAQAADVPPVAPSQTTEPERTSATPDAGPVHDAPPGVPPAGPGNRPGPGGGAGPLIAVAAVALVAIGGVVAALALRGPDAKEKPAPATGHKGKRKGRLRKAPTSE